MRFTKNTQHDTSKVLRLPRKMTMDTSKVLRLPRKMQHIFWKRRKSIAPATQNDFWMSQSATPATRNEATRRLKPPKMTTSAELTIGTAIRSSRERLRTVATTNATSSEHTLNPQTPRVEREPLLRIREKGLAAERIDFRCNWFWNGYRLRGKKASCCHFEDATERKLGKVLDTNLRWTYCAPSRLPHKGPQQESWQQNCKGCNGAAGNVPEVNAWVSVN